MPKAFSRNERSRPQAAHFRCCSFGLSQAKVYLSFASISSTSQPSRVQDLLRAYSVAVKPLVSSQSLVSKEKRIDQMVALIDLIYFWKVMSIQSVYCSSRYESGWLLSTAHNDGARDSRTHSSYQLNPHVSTIYCFPKRGSKQEDFTLQCGFNQSVGYLSHCMSNHSRYHLINTIVTVREPGTHGPSRIIVHSSPRFCTGAMRA